MTSSTHDDRTTMSAAKMSGQDLGRILQFAARSVRLYAEINNRACVWEDAIVAPTDEDREEAVRWHKVANEIDLHAESAYDEMAGASSKDWDQACRQSAIIDLLADDEMGVLDWVKTCPLAQVKGVPTPRGLFDSREEVSP